MDNELSFTINKKLWSQNERDGAHWAVRKKDRDDWYRRILLILGPIGLGIHKATGPRLMTIVRYGSRQLDAANMAGGAKGLIDAIVAHGLLQDDTPDDVVITYEQRKCKRGEEKTEIRISGTGTVKRI